MGFHERHADKILRIESMYCLDLLAWLACVVYSTIPTFWLMIHPFAGRWRARRSPYRLLIPAWVSMWIVGALITRPWRLFTLIPRLYATPWPWVPAAILFAIGIFLYRASSKSFSAKQLGGLPEVLSEDQGNHREQRLATEGIRSRVRHPVYLAHLCEMFAWSLASGLAVCWTLTAFAIVTGAVMIRMEEAELEERFGDAYANYRRSVPAILPRL